MIFHFQPLVSWPFFFGILAVMTVIGFVSFLFQWRRSVSPARIGLRMLFFFGFVACLSMVILRPQRQIGASRNQILVYENGLEKPMIAFWKDSLQIKKTVSLSKYQPRPEKVFLLGEKFAISQLYPLRNLDFDWILPESAGTVRDLAWKGYLRKGEVQRLRFGIFSESDGAKLEIPGSKLEPKTMKKGWNIGLLEFYPSGLGRAEFPMVLDKDTLTTVRFYIGAASPKKYRFQLGFPGAESRTLSRWLQEKGEAVTEQIRLSRETLLQSGRATDSLQILLVDPAQLEQKAVQDAVKDGKVALIVMNVSQAVETAQRLNRLFGTDFQAARTAPGESRMLQNGVEALPFSLSEKAGQKLLQEGSLALHYAGNSPVVLSLISASYPLSMQGKDEAYEALWGELFGLLEPDETEAWRMDAPLLSGISGEILRFSTDSLPNQLVWEKDTLYLQKNAVNPALSKGILQTMDSTWVELDSGFSAYVYGNGELQSLKTAALIREIKGNSAQSSIVEVGSMRFISPWIWMVGMLVFLGLLWLEPKL